MTPGESTAHRPVVIACTVVSRSQLPYARVAAISYLSNHPGDRFVIVVVDSVETQHQDENLPELEHVGPQWLSLDESHFLRLATWFGRDDLIEVLKPYALEAALRDADVAIFLSPRTKVYQSFGSLASDAMTSGTVVAPWTYEPLPHDGREPSEQAMARAGAFYPGLVAAGQEGKPLLEFWRGLLELAPATLGVNQWLNPLDRMTGRFRHSITFDRGLCVGYWNRHERNLQELRSFVFDAYSPDTPWILSRRCQDQARILLSADPTLRTLVRDYEQDLRDESRTGDKVRYKFNRTADGSRLTPAMRAVHRGSYTYEASRATREHQYAPMKSELPIHAFGEAEGADFRKWLSSPGSTQESAVGLNRLLTSVWAADGVLRSKYPDPLHDDAKAFRKWCSSPAARQKIPGWAKPVPVPTPTRPVDSFGANFVGFLTAEVGLGEMARLIHASLEQANVPLNTMVEEKALAGRSRTDAPWNRTDSHPDFPITLFSVNASHIREVAQANPSLSYERYRIGLWAWELEDLPVFMREQFQYVDEIWTISDFCKQAIQKYSPVPVRVFPLPVRPPATVWTKRRSPGAPIVFLFCFDFNSIASRKNPEGVVRAFHKAFPQRDDVRLVIKANSGHLHTYQREKLQYAMAGDQRIELIERYLAATELDALYASSDAYVSLHRSEGFGLTVAEAMVRGMPVIATAYSSTTEFLSADTGWPIDYRMTEVGPRSAPYPPDAHWADPNLEAAASAMKQIVDDPTEARRRGLAAREYILRTRSVEAAASWVTPVLQDAYRAWCQERRRNAAPHWRRRAVAKARALPYANEIRNALRHK